jgi:hypothetical protein
MSISHLDAPKKALESSSWVIESETDGDEYDLSGVWRIARPNDEHAMHIEFEGLDDLDVLPMERSYGCRIREQPDISLYFSRIGRSWGDNLEQFIQELNNAVA